MESYHVSPSDEMTLELLAADDRDAAVRNADAEFEAEYNRWHDDHATEVTAEELEAMHRSARLRGLLDAVPVAPTDALRDVLTLGAESVVSITGVHPDDLGAFLAAVAAEVGRRAVVVRVA